MFKSYLIVAIRNISKHKYFSVINVFGLALGMSFSLLLISFYSYVSSFDDFHSQKERIYRVISTLESSEKTDFASAPLALANRLEYEAEGIEEVTRMNASFKGDVVTHKMNIPIQGFYADANFFSVFDFEMIQGNPFNALSKPNSIVLTESVAKKFVASGDLVGKPLEIEDLGLFEVTGVVKDQRRTHLWFEALVSLSTLPAEIRGEESNPDQWTHYKNQYIYLLVDDFSDREKLQESLNSISEDVNRVLYDAKVTFKLQSLGDITPGPDLENSTGWDTDYTLIVVFATICLLILLPACFNYANISIARALKLSKEIGLRKTLGGVKTQIFLQFVTETIAIMVISLAAAFFIFMVIRPEFEDMMPGAWLDLSLTWEMLVMFFLFAVATGFLTGVFPAMHFAGLNPIQALKGKSNTKGFSRMSLRKVLIIFQFALSFLLHCFADCFQPAISPHFEL
jgi:ABC-type antimicrobial peptide transport system permease subunit